jgi:hypothetical protein
VLFRHTGSGWTTEDMLAECLTWLSQRCNGEPLFLELEIWTTPGTRNIRGHAAASDMHLQFIPGGATRTLQPLNRRAFGELKSQAKLAFGQLACHTGGGGWIDASEMELVDVRFGASI